MSYLDYYTYENTYNPKYVDLLGNPVKHTPVSHPYNFDEYVIWKSPDFNRYKSYAVYSDRLMQWDFTKYTICSQDAFKDVGQSFHNRDPKEIEKFLSLYMDQPVLLTAVLCGCNHSNGNTYYVFFYETKNK